MKIAALPPNEEERVATLLRYDVLDTEFEAAYDELTQLASAICAAPISLISLIDPERQWFKSKVGLEPRETSRDLAFCAHAILQTELLVVEDALEDDRFADNPLVQSEPHIRFYAGVPLVTSEGQALGTLCVIDRVPRKFDAEQRRALEVLAKQVMNQLELRLTYRRLQEHTQRLLDTNAAKDKFFYIIAHDLRGPFNTMGGYAKLLEACLEAPELEECREMAADIGDSCRQTLSRLEDLLEWAMCQSGTAEHSPTLFDLDVLAGEVLGLLSAGAKSKSIALVQGEVEGVEVYADRYMVFSTLQNLLHNAIKFTPEGGVEWVHFSCTESEVVIEVSDTGIGMSAEAMQSLFRLEETMSTPGTEGEEGTGLGLLLCKQFVEQHGGRLEVSSELGVGSTFQFVLPLPSPARQSPAGQAARSVVQG